MSLSLRWGNVYHLWLWKMKNSGLKKKWAKIKNKTKQSSHKSPKSCIKNLSSCIPVCGFVLMNFNSVEMETWEIHRNRTLSAMLVIELVFTENLLLYQSASKPRQGFLKASPLLLVEACKKDEAHQTLQIAQLWLWKKCFCFWNIKNKHLYQKYIN